jgi:hypothetical protein
MRFPGEHFLVQHLLQSLVVQEWQELLDAGT